MTDKRNQRRGGLYWIEDKPYISVTKVISVLAKPALRYWYGREVYRAMVADPELSEQEALAAPWKKNKKAKDRGSAVHSIVEAWKNIDEVVGEDTQYKGYAEAFSKWLDDNDITAVEHEKTVVSKQHGYAGTLDMIAKRNGDGHTFIVDVKTGKDLYPEVHLQLSAYKQALSEEGIKVDGTAALLLNEDGTYKYELGKYKLNGFLACLTIYKELEEEFLEKVGYGN